VLWLASSPAAADTFEAPAQVQAQRNGEFQYSVRYIVGPTAFQVASFGSRNVENTDAGMVGDCFCEPFCLIAPGDSVRFEVYGSLIDSTASGLVQSYVSGCQSVGGQGVTVILPMATTDVTNPTSSRAFHFSNAPNPCRDRTVFYYSLPESGPAELQILDVAGRLIATPLRVMGAPGDHAVTWDRTDAGGERVPRGIYLARFAFKGRVRVLRIQVID